MTKQVIDAEATVTTVLEQNEAFIEFKKPFQFEGETHKGIALNLDGLTGADIEQAEVTFTNLNPQMAAQTPLKEMNKGFLAIIAARAAKKPIEFIKALPAAEYSKVTTKVQVFLMSGE